MSQSELLKAARRASKLLDQISTSSDYTEFRNLTGIDEDQITKTLLLRAGGLSFKTPVRRGTRSGKVFGSVLTPPHKCSVRRALAKEDDFRSDDQDQRSSSYT
ncbi:hypothetical protein PSTT_14537 [Puccinia striiformis]|uniref:Uncharacterized protein n=1 Tax=Puccinia striiformis TaxID=27350 RepID=A0A2S4ULT7_9BASI|nr:hypothetical protein PSTT_14537 [Puccinia striiformis]